jgi:UDP-N-acetylglucosamine 1-carboxyvinyltransferase
MEELVVRGGRPLEGTVRASGAKNAALPIMAASVMVRGAVLLHRVPRLSDVHLMADILRGLGVTAEWVGPETLLLVPQDADTTVAPPELVRQIRGSVCVLGPLLASRGSATVPVPGGCVIGPRPIDLHLKALRALGASAHIEEGRIHVRAERLRGARMHLAGPHGSTALGTANAMMAAVLAEGRTVIEHAAREPEIQDLAHFLNACGARISGIGRRTLVVDGVDHLSGCEHTLIPDRLEAATFLAAGVVTGGRVTVEGVRADHMGATLKVMEAMGAAFEVGAESISVGRPKPLQPVGFTTASYAGVPTDMQPQLSALLCFAEGESTVCERVHPERFTHVPELASMGARITVREACAVIHGGEPLHGACVAAPDIRAGAALVLAGLAADGVTTIRGVDRIDRGHDDFDGRLRQLGADVLRQRVEPVQTPARKTA